MDLVIPRDDHIAGGEAFATQDVLGIECPDRGAGHLVQVLGTFCVIRVAVSEQDLHHSPLGRIHDLLQVRVIIGTGVDHDERSARLADNPGVGAVEGHGTRVGRQDAHDRRAE